MLRFSAIGLLALSLAACSDPAPPVAQAQAHYKVKSPIDPPADTSCTASVTAGIGATEPLTPGGDVGVPDLPPATGEPSFAGGPVADGQLTPDGTTRYKIDCSMSGTKTVDFTAKLEGPNNSPFGSQGKTSLEAYGKIDVEAGTGTGQVSFFSTDIFDVTPVSNAECTFKVVTDLATGKKVIDVEGGSMWVTFYCPGVTLGATEGSYCASEGTLVVNDCVIKE